MKIKYTLFGVFLAIGFSIAYAQEAIETPVEETIPITQESRQPDFVFASTTFSTQADRERATREYTYHQEVLRRLDQINFYLKKLNEK